eukprot:s792_g20.t2
MSLLWLWSWLCLCMCALAEESCSASPRPVSGNCLLQKKGVVKKVAPAHEVLELKKLDDDDDDGGDDDGDEEDEPLFDNRPGRSGNGKPLHKCQGSCSDDADCEGDLVCVTPKFVGWDGFVPGCRSGPQGKPLWEFRYCSGKPPDGWRTATTSTTTPEPTPPPPPAPSVITDCPAGGVCARLMAFNVYYAALGREDRMDGIAQAIADMTPDIAVITEQWKEKPTILEKIKQKTNKYYAFCLGGPQEKWWDGDILYRADLFEVVKDSIMDWGANRFAEPKHHKPDPGLTPRKHKDSGKKVIIYGAHPVCCGNEPIHLQNALDFAEHAKTLASGADVALFFTAGLAFSSSLSIWAWSLTQTSVANSTLLHNMMPIFTTLGAWLFFRQTCSRKFLLGMAVAMAGVTVIGVEDFQVNRGHLGDAAALLAALLSSVNILVVKQLRHHFEAPTILGDATGERFS